jgi:NADH-quinone oxidoreductase subunit H
MSNFENFSPILFYILEFLGKISFLVIPLLILMAYLTYFERRIIGFMQMRLGPNVTGPFGLLQPFADAVKLLLKEVIIPFKADQKLFLFAPMITFVLSLICWAVIPIPGLTLSYKEIEISAIANLNVGVLYLIAISSLSVYGIIIAGWASNSKYAFLGAIRSSAQMISYELSIALSLMVVFMISGSLNILQIVTKMHEAPILFKLLNIPMCVIFFIAILAETNRHPFDLPEAEAELVAGYNVEYSSMVFALFYLGEYLNMILSSIMITIFFLGAWFPPIDLKILYYVPPMVWFVLKACFVLFLFIAIRAALPRYRYDQLMRIGWKFLMPIAFFVFIVSSFVIYFY